MAYDPENIFAKILRGEIPNSTVLDTEHALAFQTSFGLISQIRQRISR